jgi:hypothetical protein
LYSKNCISTAKDIQKPNVSSSILPGDKGKHSNRNDEHNGVQVEDDTVISRMSLLLSASTPEEVNDADHSLVELILSKNVREYMLSVFANWPLIRDIQDIDVTHYA